MPEYVVTSPDGQKYKVTAPEGATQEQVRERAMQMSGAQPQQSRTYADSFVDSAKDFGEKMTADFLRRDRMATEIVAAQHAGEQTWAETALQLTGKVGIGIVSDVIFNGVVEGVQALTPDTVGEKINDGATYAAAKIFDNPVGEKGIEALYQGVEAYQEWKAENPRMARNLEGVVNIGAVWTPAKGNPQAVGAGARLQEFGKRTAQRARTLVDDVTHPSARGVVRGASDRLSHGVRTQLKAGNERAARVRAAITPDETMRNNLDLIEKGQLVERTNRFGITNRSFVPNDREFGAIDDILYYTKGSGTQTTLGIRNSAEETIRALDKELLASFTAKGPASVYNLNDVLSRLGSVQDDFLNKAAVSLRAEQKSNITKLFDKALDVISDNSPTGRGIIRARRQLDDFVESLPGMSENKLYKTDQVSAIADAHRMIRREFNDIADGLGAPGKVHDLLKRQSAIFDVMPTISKNAALEPNLWIGRQVAKLGSMLGTRNLAIQAFAAAGGLGGLGAAAALAPFWTMGIAAPFVAVKGRKWLLSSSGRKAVGAALRGTDDAIKLVGNPANYGRATVAAGRQAADLGITGAREATALLRSLKADRAALIQLLEEGQE